MVNKLKSEQIVRLLKWMESPTSRGLYLKLMGERESMLLEQLVNDDSDITRGRIKEIRQFVILHDQLREELDERIKVPRPADLDAEEKVLKS